MKDKDWEKRFDKEFTYGGITGVVALKTDNAINIKAFIKSEKEKSWEEGYEEGVDTGTEEANS